MYLLFALLMQMQCGPIVLTQSDFYGYKMCCVRKKQMYINIYYHRIHTTQCDMDK